ncbi:hypothetical protein [Streptomyces sp. NPDC029704]|uniref:hypothetical protein n=1 Tax=Streptomyces sp. NPDC029704 TaxID=3156920 RepID=UPI0033D453A9
MSDIRIIHCTTPAKLVHQYAGQSEPQPAYIELDLREGLLLADYDAEVGGAVPFAVRHGFERRYPVPLLTGSAANRVMEEIAPLAQRILSDWEQESDGSNMVARLGKDAQAAEEQLMERLGLLPDSGDTENQGFDESELVAVWDLDGALSGYEASEYEITAGTSDERLREIEAGILADLAGDAEDAVVVVPGLGAHLRQLRDDADQPA